MHRNARHYLLFTTRRMTRESGSQEIIENKFCELFMSELCAKLERRIEAAAINIKITQSLEEDRIDNNKKVTV